MKKINIWYWIITVLFAGFMIFSAVPDITMAPDAVNMITGLGYPKYFIPFIGWAKVIGSMAILIPGFRRIKEWAYAGLFFDLFGATYSAIAVSPKFEPAILFMLVFFAFLFASYFLWHRKLQMSGAVVSKK